MIDLSEIFKDDEDSNISNDNIGELTPQILNITEKVINRMVKEISTHPDKKLLALQDFQSSNSNLDLYELGETYSLIFYKDCWDVISKIDITSEKHLKVLNNIPKLTLEWSLSIMIFHFQDVEDYKKCAFLKKIIDIL